MKSGMQVAFLFAVAAVVGIQAAQQVQQKDRTITKVVKLLETMLEKSKDENKEEKSIFSTFKCHCETDAVAKAESIKEATATIALLEAKIEATQGASGELSSDVAELKAKIDAGTQAQTTANNMRQKALAAYNTETADLEAGVGQMINAMKKLQEVGADQTKASADHTQQMAGFKAGFLTKASAVTKGKVSLDDARSEADLLGLKSDISKALAAASALMTPEHKKVAASFLQGPFTGTYSAQSGEVVGILKNMRDTFKANLAEAIDTETKAAASHTDLMAIKDKALTLLGESFTEKNEALGENDGSLATDKGQLDAARDTKSSNEGLLESLETNCAAKTKGFERRKLLRASEEAAIAQAVSILNSDASFETFGTASATSTGETSLLQLSAVHRHYGAKTTRVAKIVALMERPGNPFDEVLEEVEKMIKVIDAEGLADDNKFKFCTDERKTNNDEKDAGDLSIAEMDGEKDTLQTTISHVDTGLKATINTLQTTLDNLESDKAEDTTTRHKENLAYQTDVANLTKADSLLIKAVKVLRTFYADLEKKIAEASLVQRKKHAQAPEAWKGEGEFTGQKVEGNSALNMLEFIQTEGVQELQAAHDTELAAQHDFEDEMQRMIDVEKTGESDMKRLQGQLAEKEKELLMVSKNLKATTNARDKVVEYLSSIKQGCDFITNNIEERKESRLMESNTLTAIDTKIKNTPAYKAAALAALNASYGACKDKCEGVLEPRVECQACMADVTVVGYCVGNPNTPGCPA